MTDEEKKLNIINYINGTAITLMREYPKIISGKQVERAIDMFQDSHEDYETVVSKIDAIVAEMIAEYKKKKNKQNENETGKKIDEVTAEFNEQMNSCDKKSLERLDLIYLYRKLETIKNETPLGDEDTVEKRRADMLQKVAIELSEKIKRYTGQELDLESAEFKQIMREIYKEEKQDENSALNLVSKYKDALIETYLEDSRTLSIALPTHGLTSINAAMHRENKYHNEIVNAIFAISGYGLDDYIVRANSNGMIREGNTITFSRNPFDLSASTADRLQLANEVSVYSVPAESFEPVIDFRINKYGEPRLLFDQEWISRTKSLECQEERVTSIPATYLSTREVRIADEEESINDMYNNRTESEEEQEDSFDQMSSSEKEIYGYIKEKNQALASAKKEEHAKQYTLTQSKTDSDGFSNAMSLIVSLSIATTILILFTYFLFR